jgi:hypothetical protein
VLGGIAAVFLLVIAGAVWFFTRPAPTPPGPDPRSTSNNGQPVSPNPPPPNPPPPNVPLSTVSFIVSPWANVTVAPVAGGSPVKCTTPCHVQLAAGEYDLAFENGGLSPNLSERLSVPAGQPFEVRRNMPGFNVDQAVSSIVGTPR